MGARVAAPVLALSHATERGTCAGRPGVDQGATAPSSPFSPSSRTSCGSPRRTGARRSSVERCARPGAGSVTGFPPPRRPGGRRGCRPRAERAGAQGTPWKNSGISAVGRSGAGLASCRLSYGLWMPLLPGAVDGGSGLRRGLRPTGGRPREGSGHGTFLVRATPRPGSRTSSARYEPHISVSHTTGSSGLPICGLDQ